MFDLFRRKPSFSDLRYEALTLAQDMPGHVMAAVSYDDGTTEELPYAKEALNEIEDAMADALDRRITQRKARRVIGEELDRMRQVIETAKRGGHATIEVLNQKQVKYRRTKTNVLIEIGAAVFVCAVANGVFGAGPHTIGGIVLIASAGIGAALAVDYIAKRRALSNG